MSSIPVGELIPEAEYQAHIPPPAQITPQLAVQPAPLPQPQPSVAQVVPPAPAPAYRPVVTNDKEGHTVIDGIKIGDKIVTNDHRYGTVKDLFYDGKAMITADKGYDFEWPTRNMSHVPTKIGQFKIGDKIVTTDRHFGTITHLYYDDTADISWDSHALPRLRYPTANIGLRLGSLDGFKLGDRIVTHDHRHGTITNLYYDHTADISCVEGRAPYTFNWPTKMMAPPLGSLDGFKLGDQIVTDDHRHGTIQKLFYDHTAYIRSEYGWLDFTWPTKKMALRPR